MHGKPRHRWEIHKLDKKSVLESKRIHENLQQTGCNRKFTPREEYDKAVYYHIVCIICTQKTSLEQRMPTKEKLIFLFYSLKQRKVFKFKKYWMKKTFDTKMNANITKTMLVSKDVGTLTNGSLKIDGDIIKQTDKYTYLGENITSKWKMWLWSIENNLNCKSIQFDVENYNCTTHKYETRKIIINACVVDTFIRMWNVDNNHQKHDKIAIVWKVAYWKMMKISWREKKTHGEVLEMVDEQLYIIPTIKKRKITYFGHMIQYDGTWWWFLKHRM